MADVLFLVSNFPPEISTGRLEYELSSYLLKKGHQVKIVTSFPRSYLTSHQPEHGKRLIYREVRDGLYVIRMGPEFSQRDNLFMRGFEYFFQFFTFLLGGLVSGKADIIICSSPPLSLALAAYFLGKIKRAPVITRIGDLHPQELVDLGFVRSKRLIRLLELIERFVYRKTNFFTVLSQGYQKHLLEHGANPERVIIVPNWGDTGSLEHSDVDIPDRRFTITYAGIMSWPQDLETIIDAAFLLKENEAIRFLLVGDGPQKKHLVNKVKKLQLQNVTFLPLQPKEEYFQILNQSQICLVSLKKALRTTTIPSKLLDIMASGRPILANVPYGEVSEILQKANCGIWIEPQNPEEFAKAILTLYHNPKQLVKMGRNALDYLEKHYTLNACGEKYESLIRQLLNEQS